MNPLSAEAGVAKSRSSAITIASIAVVAYALCDMTHEVLGHGTATLAAPEVTAVSLTTVALSTLGSSRLVAAAGTIANIVVSLVAFTLWRRASDSVPARYFWWLSASLNLFNATAYLLYSGISDSGDWAVVTAGLEPHVLWRCGMVVLGAASYAVSVHVSATTLARMVRAGDLPHSDIPRLSYLPYWAGGALLVAGALPNPVSPWLILSSGASSGFGAMAGLLWLPQRVAAPRDPPAGARPLPFSLGWVVAAILVSAVFVLVIGRGIRL